MISVRRLTFTFPGASRPALRDVDLDVAEAEFLVVAGPSGSGKSTLARASCGIVPHQTGGTIAGSVSVAGRDVRAHRPRDLADVVAFVSQDPTAQSVADRVADDIVFAMENLGVEPTIMRKRLEEILDALDLAPLRDRPLDTLSGGERQRAAIAAALASQPKCLILDEPTSQLDPQSAEDVLGVIHRLNTDLGLTVVLVEHRLERVVQHADRVVVLGGGRVVDEGTPREVLARGAVVTPLSAMARVLGREDVPLTIREGRALAASVREALTPRGRTPVAVGEPLVEARALSVARGRRDVLRGVDLTVRGGETLAIVGRNGAGKTTLLRTLLGLVRPYAGARVVASMDPDRVPLEHLAARVAYVPQTADSILFHETVRDEVAFTLAARARDASVDDVVARAGLHAFASTDPRDLSAGERLRVALLAATAGDPQVILLDEPTRGMDARGKEALARELASWREHGRATVLVTHDVELVARVATRVALMAEGEIVVDGPVRDVLGDSALFSSQMNKVFADRRFLTVEDVEEALR